MKKCLIAVVTIMSLSCSDGKDSIVVEFNQLYADILKADAASIDGRISLESRGFLDELTSIEDLTMDAVLGIGKKYGIQDFLFGYFLNYKKEIEKNNDSRAFYTYLSLQEVPLFSFSNVYSVNKEMTKVNPDIFVAITRKEFTSNYLNWVRFLREDDAIKYDLLYTLQLANKKSKEVNDVAFKDSKLNDKTVHYQKLMDFIEPAEYSQQFIAQQKAKRDSMVELNQKLKITN